MTLRLSMVCSGFATVEPLVDFASCYSRCEVLAVPLPHHVRCVHCDICPFHHSDCYLRPSIAFMARVLLSINPLPVVLYPLHLRLIIQFVDNTLSRFRSFAHK